MAYNKNNYVRIKEEFSQKHRDKVNAADERKFLLESKYPELAEIDAALRLTAMKIYGALFVNERESLDKIKEENEIPRCFDDYKIEVDEKMPEGVELIEKL